MICETGQFPFAETCNGSRDFSDSFNKEVNKLKNLQSQQTNEIHKSLRFFQSSNYFPILHLTDIRMTLMASIYINQSWVKCLNDTQENGFRNKYLNVRANM